MTTQHTPGPWTIRPYNFDDVQGAHGIFPEGCRIPICHSIMGNDLGQADANARLIAAAPDLLAALKAMHSVHRAFSSSADWTVLDDDARAAAENAIAKATGGGQ